MKVKKDLSKRIEVHDEVDDSVFNNFDDIDSLGDKMFNNESQGSDIPKELFNEKLVKARSRLTQRKINNISRAFYQAKIFGLRDLEALLLDYLTLEISLDGKSRSEFVQALQAKLESDKMNLQQAPVQAFRGR